VRALLLSLLATLVGAAMVAGGIWGLVSSFDDDDNSSGSALAATPSAKTSAPDDCSQVAEHDKRFLLPHDLLFGPYGRATVQCEGTEVTFAIEIDELQNGTFYEVVLERGRHEYDVGSILPVGVNDVSTVSVDTSEVPLRKYDFLTVRVDDFHNPGVDQPPFRAAL
jgi:hypothetical protein